MNRLTIEASRATAPCTWQPEVEVLPLQTFDIRRGLAIGNTIESVGSPWIESVDPR